VGDRGVTTQISKPTAASPEPVSSVAGVALALPFNTDRLTVRMMRSSDAAPVAAYRNDPQVAELQDWDLPYTVEHAMELLRRQDEMVTPDRAANLALERDGEVIGDLYVGFGASNDNGGIAEIGYTLARAHQGKGYAREAAAELVARLFAECGMHRVEAKLSPANRASMRVLEHIGLVYEYTTKLTFPRRDGTWEDDMCFAITRDEYERWKARPTEPPADVQLVAITHHNSAAYRGLATHWSQRNFVAPMDDSFIDALVGEDVDGHPVVPWFRGIVADGEPAGFVMLADVTEHHPDPFLWRLLIDRRHQRRGIGERVLQMIVERTRTQGATGLMTSWVPDLAGSPEPFYRRVGFEPTGEIDDGEVVARLDLTG
jgi:RimJ/RimL family protein N-acetyltransferase